MGERGGNANTGAKAPGEMTAKDGTEPIFAHSWDASLTWYDARARLDQGMTHILTRDEDHAAHLAAGYAGASGKPGNAKVDRAMAMLQDAQAPMRNWVV
jgi:acetolactate synthase-1/2/3 large subunit